ncbi:MAG: adaptor protein MecA [Lachnospiraceae bacterium]|nr:adaptor protein MecA [Lachnospiraceae bacterium]
MKIEKISDNQIKCTLTQEDLANYNIRLSELAYGTDKARKLFQEMMTEAYKEVGFEVNHTPLMIEAIPDKENSLVLIISKVDDPDELDTRFAKYSPTNLKSDENAPAPIEGADDIIDLFKKLREKRLGTAAKAGKDGKDAKKEATGQSADADRTAAARKDRRPEKPVNLTRIYNFESIDEVIRCAKALESFYQGANSLYRKPETGEYLLVVHQSSHTPEEFNKVCNILSEYAVGGTCPGASEAYLMEHKKAVIAGNALQRLATF